MKIINTISLSAAAPGWVLEDLDHEPVACYLLAEMSPSGLSHCPVMVIPLTANEVGIDLQAYDIDLSKRKVVFVGTDTHR